MYCPSRWTGIHTSCKAALSTWPGLIYLKNNLIINGHGGELVDDTAAVEEEDSDIWIDSTLSREEVLNSDNTVWEISMQWNQRYILYLKKKEV